MFRYVLYSPRDGVYLGNALGLGFWSLLDPVGQDAAVTFASRTEAMEHVAEWDNQPSDLTTVPVIADENGYSSIAACVAAGLPGWEP